ncbi:MAG: GNAT family N-acetyltransferase [Oscillospiraceae bacterium]|nr:GNAT family N-acetyltransferase [Oscillospiraceae bacterium]
MIRSITLNDREFFLEAADEFYHSDAVEKPLPMEKLTAVFDEMMRSDIFLEGFILEYKGERAGYCVTSKAFQTEAGGVTLWIEDIYIKKQFRGIGLGNELFDFLYRHFEGKVKRYRLEAEPDNKPAMGLYMKNGFRILEYTQLIKDV